MNMKTEDDLELELLEEYKSKLELIMENYIKGNICSIEYSIELEHLERWMEQEKAKRWKTL